MNVFVTGATGVLGRRVVPLLVADGHHVTAVARSPEKAAALEAAGARSAEVSLFDTDALRGALAGHDAVLNLATHIPPLNKGAWPGAWKENDRIRTEGSRAVADAAIAAGVARHVQESITFPYADGGADWIDETSPLDVPPSLQSSQVAEAQAPRVTDAGGTGIVLRFAMFYGPDSSHTIDQARLARRGQVPMPGRPDAYASWVHLDDAARAVVAALDLPAGTYNVVEDEPITRGELADVMARTAGRDKLSWLFSKASRLGGRKVEALARSQRVSNRTLREASDWRPEHPSVREGWPAVVGQIERQATHA